MAVAALAACGGGSTEPDGPSGEDLVGDWSLVSIDGDPLPHFEGRVLLDSTYRFRGDLKVYGTFAGGANGNTTLTLRDSTYDIENRPGYDRLSVLNRSIFAYMEAGRVLLQPLDGASAFTDPDTATLHGDTLIVRSRESAGNPPYLFVRTSRASE